jgi:hypothetical protein
MPTDSTTLIGLAIGAVILAWLVFSVLRKLFGFALIAAVVLAVTVLWFNPGLASQLWSQIQMLLGTR